MGTKENINPDKKSNSGHKGGQPGNINAEKWTEEKALSLGRELIEWLNKPPEFKLNNKGTYSFYRANIFHKYYLTSNGYDDDTITYLSKKFPSFSELIKRAKIIQECKINEMSINGYLSNSMSIFLLKNHHGYRDKHEIESSGSINLNFDKDDKDL
jgi:hypothetical protein